MRGTATNVPNTEQLHEKRNLDGFGFVRPFQL
jgi:hypothetical protein